MLPDVQTQKWDALDLSNALHSALSGQHFSAMNAEHLHSDTS